MVGVILDIFVTVLMIPKRRLVTMAKSGKDITFGSKKSTLCIN